MNVDILVTFVMWLHGGCYWHLSGLVLQFLLNTLESQLRCTNNSTFQFEQQAAQC